MSCLWSLTNKSIVGRPIYFFNLTFFDKELVVLHFLLYSLLFPLFDCCIMKSTLDNCWAPRHLSYALSSYQSVFPARATPPSLLTKWRCTTRLPRHHQWWWFSIISLVVTPSLDCNMLDAFDTPLSTRPCIGHIGKGEKPRRGYDAGGTIGNELFIIFLGQWPIIILGRGAPTFREGWNVL